MTSTSSKGGQYAIAGFLFQIIRSLQLGTRVSVQLQLDDEVEAENTAMLLTLEPDDGGDLQLRAPKETIVEQVKMRAHHRAWSSGDIAKLVFPDLLKAVSLTDSRQYRMVTDNARGTEELQRFARHFQSSDTSETDSQFRWGHQRLSADKFLEKLASAAKVDPCDPKFCKLMQCFDIEVIDTVSIERDLDHLLSQMLAPGQNAEDKREEITSRMLKAASKGQVLSDSDLLSMIGSNALLRLEHARNLPDALKSRLQSDLEVLGYDHSKQVRADPRIPTAPITLFAGESGQGKTWAMSQAAQAQMENRELAIAFRAPTTFEEVVSEINERIWLPAYSENTSITEIARRLRPAAGGDKDFWLTVYVDDLQDRKLARKLASYDWAAVGIRIALSCQPRIVREFLGCQKAAEIHHIDNLTSAELRSYLRYHGRDAPLETMPDDVFELLLKPIHAKIFVELPERGDWVDCTEYEFMKRYWDFATRQAREQGDHPSDASGLQALAGRVLGKAPRYPWTLQDVQSAGLEDAALQRLEQVGLVWWPRPDRFGFTLDRMLNWAVAEQLCARVLDENWTPEQVDQELERIDSIESPNGDPVGRRLGYVFLDTIWLLSKEVSPQFVADVLLTQMRRLPHEWRQEAMWTRHISTIGKSLLPVLEALALKSYDEETEWDIPCNIHFAIAAIAKEDADAAVDTIERLIKSDKTSAIDIGVDTAGKVFATRLLDLLWGIHRQRVSELDAFRNQPSDEGGIIQLLSRRDASSKAIKMALTPNLSWLENRIKTTNDSQFLEHLLWLLCDRDLLDGQLTIEIWARQKERFHSILAQDSLAIIHALQHFSDIDGRDWLDGVPLSDRNSIHDRVLSSRAQLDPAAALKQIRNHSGDHGWKASNWWLPALARSCPKELSDAVLDNARKSDDPLTDVVLYYARFPELMNLETLEWVLDNLTDRVAQFNAEHATDPDHQTGPLGHPFTFLPRLVHPWQFDCLARRAGTQLEDELVCFATARSGRSSRTRDTQGQECERILAMMAGQGFNELVISELDRTHPMGREDGYVASIWTEAKSVRDALGSAQDIDDDGFGRVQQMQAVAVHQLDMKIERMVRAGAPIYVNAAEMRSANGRSINGLKKRVSSLLAGENREDLHTAVRLAGFLKNPQDAEPLLAFFVDPAIDDEIKQAIVGTFRALRFFDPQVVRASEKLIVGRYDDETQFVAGYLASCGDANAREIVTDWLRQMPKESCSSSHFALIHPLLDHDDSRIATLDFLGKVREQGRLSVDSYYVRQLAEGGDERAKRDLLKEAYRSPRFGADRVLEAIHYLKSVDPDEAFFAAKRLFVRHGHAGVINLMFEVDDEAAASVLLDAFLTARPSLRADIARRFRTSLSADKILTLLEPLAVATSVAQRRLAAELAGWMPSSLDFPWLDDLLKDVSITVRATAEEAMARRTLERSASEHLSAVPNSSKPLKWARIQTIFECVDPYFLWSKSDPMSLGALLDAELPEMIVEARHLHRQRSKKVADDSKKLDREQS